MASSKNSRKVLMVLESNYPTEGGGGAEGQLRTLCRYLKAHGVPVSVIVPMRADGAQQEHDSVDGVRVWRIPFPKLRKIGGAVMLARLVFALFRRRREYHVIHAHMANNMAVACCAVGCLLGKPVIVKITGSLELDQGFLDARQRGPGVQMKRWLFRSATYFQATSNEIRDRLLEQGISSARVRVIPNAVDTPRFATLNTAATRAGDHPATAVCVGRLSAEKAPDVLLDAWLEAFPPDAKVRLLLVGDGAMREVLERRIEEFRRGEQIRLLGPQRDITPYLAEADIAVLPSLHEGLSNALLEYMAAGLPVLGTRISGTVDFIEHGLNGWLVEPGDRGQLAAGLRALLETDHVRLRAMGEAARQRVVSRARTDIVVGQLADLYEIDMAVPKPVPQNRIA